MSPGGSGSLKQRVERALTLPLFEQPGTAWRYGESANVLARVMEVATDRPFPEILRQRRSPASVGGAGDLRTTRTRCGHPR